MSDYENNDLFSKLTDREKKILKEKFGLESLDQSSLEQLSENIDVTREKIKEIEEKAMKKLNLKNDPENDGPEAA